MTTSISPTGHASCYASLLQTDVFSFPLSDVNFLAAVIRFSGSPFIYFQQYLNLYIEFGGTFGSGFGFTSETYKVLMVTDLNSIGSTGFVNGNLDPDQVPFPAWFFGTAPYIELASLTITDYGFKTFELDLSELTRMMMKTERTGDTVTTWDGNLDLWITANQDSYLAGVNAVTCELQTAGTITYANRFTGLQGPWQARSRVDECPVCGDRLPREDWSYSPWHQRMTCPVCVDPEDPYDTPLIIETEDPLGGGED